MLTNRFTNIIGDWLLNLHEDVQAIFFYVGVRFASSNLEKALKKKKSFYSQYISWLTSIAPNITILFTLKGMMVHA